MKRLVLLTISLLLPFSLEGQETYSIVFWNLENFFDYTDQSQNASDTEFSSRGSRHWTKKRFFSKCIMISKAIFQISDKIGQIPDLICLAEVENRNVLRKLISETNLSKADYGIIHYDSPDPRGIDCAILFNKATTDTFLTRPVPVEGVITRDILLAAIGTKDGDSLLVTVNHHPSKYGGKASEDKRLAAVRTLIRESEKMKEDGWDKQIAIGDFNDTPASGTYSSLSEIFTNLSRPLSERGEGSIRFDGKWQLIDQCFVSPSLTANTAFCVCHLPFLTVRDAAYSGEKPFRTYSGPRYIGGVSDHCPVLLTISKKRIL